MLNFDRCHWIEICSGSGSADRKDRKKVCTASFGFNADIVADATKLGATCICISLLFFSAMSFGLSPPVQHNLKEAVADSDVIFVGRAIDARCEIEQLTGNPSRPAEMRIMPMDICEKEKVARQPILHLVVENVICNKVKSGGANPIGESLHLSSIPAGASWHIEIKKYLNTSRIYFANKREGGLRWTSMAESQSIEQIAEVRKLAASQKCQ